MKKFIFFVYLVPFLFSIPVGMAYNSTASMPVGWYLLFTPQNIKTGDTVLACVPDNDYSSQGISRGYIPVSETGKCPMDTVYIVKKVAAVPGDEVKLAESGITVNGHPTPYKVILHSPGREDVPISHFPYGNYDVDGYFLISTYNRLSYDSRYFGYVGKRDIYYKALFMGKSL